MKRNVTKVLSIICLLGVLAGAFLPFATITGQYKEFLTAYTGMFSAIPEEEGAMIKQLLGQVGIEMDFEAISEALENLTAPIGDGKLSIMDFYEMSNGATEVYNLLGGLTTEGLAGEEYEVLEQLGIAGMIDMLGQFGVLCQMVSYVLLAPIGLFGLLALAVIVRIILRLFNRRGLGVIISLLTILNAAFMIGLPVLLNTLVGESLPISAEFTYVPVVMVVCSIASCIIWGIGRGAKVKVVKEVPVEVPVAQPAPVEEAPVVEEAVAEETVTEETVVEETVAEEVAVEEEVEAAAEDVVVDAELVEEVVEEETTEE